MNRLTKKGILFAAALILLSAAALRADDQAYDGIYWRACAPDVKRLFVHGVLGGVMLGQDRVAGSALMLKGSSGISPECHRSLIGMVNSLERQASAIDREHFVNALDTFYDVPENRSLDIKWGVLVVMLEMRDTPEEEIQEYIYQLKRGTPPKPAQ